MGLPKLTRPEYSTTIPSNNKKIKYHPFTVREEKILMLAAEGGDSDEIVNAVVNVLEKCVSSPQDFKVKDLALFDIEFLFLKARSKSVGEVIEVTVTDPNDPETSVEHEINIDRIGIKKNKDHTSLIDVTPEVKVQMRYPGIEFFTTGIDVGNLNKSLDIISKCVQSIVHDEEVYNREDMSEEEVTEWLQDLSTEQFNKILKFFETAPKLSHTITAHNPKTDKDFSITLEGLADFF
jgi:hypothetical protein